MGIFGKIDSTLDSLSKMLDVNTTNAQVDESRAELTKLMNIWMDADRQERDLSGNSREARRNYFRYLYSNDNAQLKLFYNTEAEPLFQSLKDEKDAIIAQIDESNYFYNSQQQFLSSINSGTIDPNIVASFNPPDINTRLRKSELYQKSDSMVNIWTNIMNCIILVYGFILLYVFRNNLLDPLVLLTITLTFASVFILEPMLKFLYYIPASIFSYIGWGYTSVEFSKWWYLWIPASLIAIYIIISSLL
jgi:hypothetical protein